MREPKYSPIGKQVNDYIRRPAVGNLSIINLRTLSVWLYEHFDEKIPYFDEYRYDIHQFILDSLEYYLYDRCFQGLSKEEQIFAIMEALYPDTCYAHNERFDSKICQSIAVGEIERVLKRVGIPKHSKTHEFDYTLDTGMTLWIVQK